MVTEFVNATAVVELRYDGRPLG